VLTTRRTTPTARPSGVLLAQLVKAVKAFDVGAKDLKGAGEHPGILGIRHHFPYPEAFGPPAR
jgi:hypothetical protein